MCSNSVPETKPESVRDPVGVFYDCLLLPEEKMLFHGVISRHGQRSHVDFQLSLTALKTADAEHLKLLQYCLKRWNRQQGDSAWVISRLLGIALEQQGILDKDERDKQVRHLVLYGSEPSAPAPPEQVVKSKEQISEGVSFLLLFIRPRVRNRLRRVHGVDVDELQKESEQLHRDVSRFWEVIPPDHNLPPERYFWHAAEEFDKRVVAHHKKVKRVGKLVGGELGKVLVKLAELGINYLSAPREEKVPKIPGS